MRTRKGIVSVIALCVTFGTSVVHADEGATDLVEARKQFVAGVNLLDDPDGAKYEEAYHAFKKAFALSRNPKVLGNIGFCAMHLERDGEAIEAYSTYLRETPDIDERERTQIQRDLATLTSTVARVKITVKHSASSFVLVDTRVQTRGSAVENTYPIEGKEITLRLRPGRHTFKAKVDNLESVVVEALVEPASDTAHEIRFAPPRPAGSVIVKESPSYAGPVFLGVTGVLALSGGVVTGLLASDKQRDIERSCPNDVCPATYELDGERDKAKTFGTIADAAFIGGGALIAGSALWYLLVPKNKSGGGMTASAMCTGTGCGLSIGRGFW
jgi:hypothetical protein